MSIFLRKNRIRFSLDTGISIEGVILRRGWAWIRLGDVRVEVNGQMVPAVGYTMVSRRRILFGQSIPAGVIGSDE